MTRGMSKGSQQQQPTTSRDRGPSAAPRPKQPVKGEGNTNGAKAAPPRDASKKASTDDIAHEFAVMPSESAEDDFFARGDEVNSSFPPAALDVLEPELDDRPEAKP